MNTMRTGKELAVDEQKTIVAQTAHEELLVAISEVTAARYRQYYENCLFNLVQKHFDIKTTGELNKLSPDKRKVLEEVILKRALETWSKARVCIKICSSIATLGLSVFLGLAYFIHPAFLICSAASCLLYIPNFSIPAESPNKKFLDAYDQLHGGAKNE